MADPQDSPAVQSYLREEAGKRAAEPDGQLDSALENTFPASDPVSATNPAVPVGRVDKDSVASDDYRLVDDALNATGQRRNEPPGARRNVSGLKQDAARISERAGEVASGAAYLSGIEARTLLRNVEEKVRERPLIAVGIVAAIAFVLGVSR